MSRQEAAEQYSHALKLGQRYYKNSLAHGGYPYPPVLDDMIDETTIAGRADIGLVNIPSELIVGTKTAGRVPAFAGNFMPLLEEGSEFAEKWISLCSAHLGDEGIRDAVKCCEYLGKFYVQEGNKRVSVLKSYRAPTIQGIVTRLVPEYSQEHTIQVYYEFMHFYQLSRLYSVEYRHRGQYRKLQALLGFDEEHVWTDKERLGFSAGFTHFKLAFDNLNSAEKVDVTAAEALLVWLQVYPFAEIKEHTQPELIKMLSAIWPDIKALTDEQPIEVSTEPDERDKSLIAKLISVAWPEHLNIAFIYAFDPVKSAWTRAQDHGREYLAQRLGNKVSVKVYPAYTGDYYGAMESAVADGAQVIFATTPHMIDAARRIAAEHSGVKVLNCALSLPYTGVRMYYARIYESKFITGAIAGAMAESDTVGYISNYPIFGVPASVNAFALGVRMTNPRARVKLAWTCTPGDPLADFLSEGITVISNRDATNPMNEHWALEWGTYKLAQDGTMIPLAVPCWNWGRFYEKVIMSIFSGAWNDVPDNRAINYWWGMDSGVTDVQLSSSLPDGVHSLADILKKGIISGEVSPFRTRITDQHGVLRCDGERELSAEEIMRMDWFCDNVDGELPAFDALLPRSQGLVRLLGIYRNELPPEKEAKQL